MDHLCDQIRQASSFPNPFVAREAVSMSYAGLSAPDMSNPVIAGSEAEGAYTTYVAGPHWWMVKEVRISGSPGKESGLERWVVRDYGDKVLSYTDFQNDKGAHSLLSAHLDREHYQASLGPLAGRRWNKGSIASLIQEMTAVRQRQVEGMVEIDGRYKKMDAHLTIDPQHGYLATNLVVSSKEFRTGFNILKAQRFLGAWLPLKMKVFSGEYRMGQLAKGSEGEVNFSGIASSKPPNLDQVPLLPPGSVLGSEESRLYRVAPDGTLIDFGRQGFEPGTSLAWGDLFVLSGAGLLLGSLSWLIFRKRRSSPSPLREGPPRRGAQR